MEPFECDSCGKLFCKICISDWMAKNPVTKCPNRCTSQIKAIQSKALKKVYENLEIKCINPKCNKICRLGDLDAHEAICLKVKCWNFEVCGKVENEGFQGKKPCCSETCCELEKLVSNFGNVKEMYKIISNLKPAQSSMSPSVSSSGGFQSLTWNSQKFGTGIVISESNTHVFLKEQAYVFRSVVSNVGFSSGINYWEIIADARTEN